MTVPALLLVPAAAEDTPSPSTTAETAATEANLIPVICSPHSSALPTGGAGPEPSPAIDLERTCLLKYTRADMQSSAYDALPLPEYVGYLAEVGLDIYPAWLPDVRGRC